MPEPFVVPRSQHAISRRDIDRDALRVLYRLNEAHHIAYLVGGSVRDLLIGRKPKDFDVGTSAHPYEVKRLFRRCWIIGRRFRLAHVQFGPKIIEVATFRRQLPAGAAAPAQGALPHAPHQRRDLLIERDNTFGTPEEDAFRRDFTVNALFYDIGTFSIIDYVGGLKDLQARVVRAIGDPDERLQEDPVRMLRAIALAARLGFDIDSPTLAAIQRQRHEIARSAPARLLEEYFKILRAGSAELAFRMLREHQLLERITPELADGTPDALWGSLRALDSYRRRFETTPDTLTNRILLGTVMVPLGLVGSQGASWKVRRELEGTLGVLPIARRDVERLRQILALQGRLLEGDRSPRAKHALTERPAFAEALTWLDIHGDAPEVCAHWQGLLESGLPPGGGAPPDLQPRPHDAGRYRRRRRRRRFRKQIA